MTDQETIKSRLLSRVVVDQATGCWNWTGSKIKFGYGRMGVDGRTYCTHRLSYQVFVGDIPEGLCVCHKCDNPSCINPVHLFLGTHSENMLDAYRKGRVSPPEGDKVQYKKGHKAFNRVLPDNQVIEIKQMLKTGIAPSVIARKMNLKRQVVADIKRGQAYFDVT
jgi:hypothetical protein